MRCNSQENAVFIAIHPTSYRSGGFLAHGVLKADKRPRLDIVINFAKILGVKAEYLLDDSDIEEDAFTLISTAVARKGGELTAEEKNKLIAMIAGMEPNV